MPTPATPRPAVDLPADLQPPFPLALAKATDSIPTPGALLGGSQYEPKWDGFRLAIVRDGDTTSLWSRQGKDLTGGFPDLAAAAAEQLPPGFVLDGEAVIWTDGHLNFDRLQQRLTARGPALARQVRRSPAVFIGFDLLAAAGHDLRQQPLSTRRTLLETLAADWTGPLQLSPATTDPVQAQAWFTRLPATGIEGLVVKGRAQPYTGGRREWVKVKHRDTVEVVCAAITGTLTRPEELIVGLLTDGALRLVGRSTRLTAAAARSLAPHLRPPTGPHPWAGVPLTADAGRFGGSREPAPVFRVEPIVIEISADTAMTGSTYRHPVRYVRTRPELAPAHLQTLAEAS